MAPPSGLHQSAIPSDFESAPFPPLVRSSTVPASLQNHRSDPSHLAPEDAFASFSPPRRSGMFDAGGNGSGSDARPRRIRRSNNGGSRSRSRRRKRFQKLLWVKQSYPDNYTDQATFLENLQRNPRVQPYDFWPLVADSTVIVQHVCSVIIFIVCFVGIFQERVSPVAVVGWSTFATSIGWLLWDYWVGQESEGQAAEEEEDNLARTRRSLSDGPSYRDSRPPPPRQDSSHLGLPTPNASTTSFSSLSNLPSAASSSINLLQEQHSHSRPYGSSSPGYTTAAAAAAGHNGSSSLLIPGHSHSRSVSSVHSIASQASHARAASAVETEDEFRHRIAQSTQAGKGRAYIRLGAVKSAVLIYFTLLGLSPILKSLTRSTSSDSIWAMSFWLLAINIFFFDHSGSWAPGLHKFPVASLSTNAALMASTVLASRLPSTGQVFSLTLFSIEVFGLFPVFRRAARLRSWRYHVILTTLLIMGAGGGVGMILGGEEQGGGSGSGGGGIGAWPWKNGLVGIVVGCLIAALAMGGCSWWLIGLQKYKNEIYGPWDPARPIIINRSRYEE